MNMELTLAVTALVVITVVYALASIRARRALDKATEDRNAIYRGCFLRGLAGILARMAGADGTVTLDEVNVVGRLFNDMGLSEDDRKLCFEQFKTAKESNLPMSYYASLFAPYSTNESRVLVYEILWDIASADGRFDPAESAFLKDLLGWLSLDESHYKYNLNRCSGFFSEQEVKVKEAGRKLDKFLN